MNKLIAVAILFFSSALTAETKYNLTYSAAGDSVVKVNIVLPAPHSTPLAFVMPRNYSGGYDLVLYDSFVENVRAFSDRGTPIAVEKALAGSRWTVGSSGDQVSRIEYNVDIRRMEDGILSAVETSKIRPGYVGLLGYSIFGCFEGLEVEKIALEVKGPKGWPVYSTLTASVPAPIGNEMAAAADYYALADSQVLMGPDLHLQRFDGVIGLTMAITVKAPKTRLSNLSSLAQRLSVCNAISGMLHSRLTPFNWNFSSLSPDTATTSVRNILRAGLSV